MNTRASINVTLLLLFLGSGFFGYELFHSRNRNNYPSVKKVHPHFQGLSGADDSWTLCSNEPPDEEKLWPSVSNGHVGFHIHGDSVYMNGLYSGANVTCRRARIPAVTSLSLETLTRNHVNKTFCLHMDTGIFQEVHQGDHWSLTMMVYAHRVHTRLLVTEMVWKTDGRQPEMTFRVKVNRGNDSEQIDFVKGMTNGTRKYIYGNVKEAETPTSGKTPIHVFYTAVPPTYHVPGGAVIERREVALMSLSPFKHEAEDAYENGMTAWRTGTLRDLHINKWRELHVQGRIDVTGNVTLARAVHSSMYYITSNIPAVQDATWPFVGLSPAGLASNGYNGHVFWDQDTWMYPPVLLLHPDLGRILVQTRTRSLNGSYTMAQRNGYQGAQYAWESALTGEDVDPWKPSRVWEIHVTGDVALAFQQYLMMTRDTDVLVHDGMKDSTFAIAEYWKARSNYSVERDEYEIFENMPPDEWHYPVNNSAYCNYVARLSLLLPSYVCRLLGCTAPAEYEQIANKMYIPFDDNLRYHPEFDGYNTSQQVKQGDVILLSYPLQMPMDPRVRYNDLEIYQNLTGDGPAMTWGMFAIGWLDVDESQKAEEMFFKQLGNMRGPFNVWTEQADGSGVTNFITGQGGFLQSVLNGYGGIRIFENQILAHCRPLPGTNYLAVMGLDYLGKSLDINCDRIYTNVTLTTVNDTGHQLYLKEYRTKRVRALEPNVTIQVPTQKLSISPDPGVSFTVPIIVGK